MTLEEAVEMLETEYERAKNLEYVINPLAWALYHTWRKADRDYKKGGKKKCNSKK